MSYRSISHNVIDELHLQTMQLDLGPGTQITHHESCHAGIIHHLKTILSNYYPLFSLGRPP